MYYLGFKNKIIHTYIIHISHMSNISWSLKTVSVLHNSDTFYKYSFKINKDDKYMYINMYLLYDLLICFCKMFNCDTR